MKIVIDMEIMTKKFMKIAKMSEIILPNIFGVNKIDYYIDKSSNYNGDSNDKYYENKR